MNCDPIARWYRWFEYASFGRALERRREAFLGDAIDARRILVVGEGDGRFLAKLVRQNPRSAIDYVDLSEAMLNRARERAGKDCVVYHHADALTIPLADNEYDLVVTHFFLDCLTKETSTRFVERIARASRPGARWIVSEFRDRTHWARIIVGSLYFFFRIATGLQTRALVDHHALLKLNGFVLTREEIARGGLLASELWTMDTDESNL